MKNPNGNSDLIARRLMDALLVEQRVLGAETPDTAVRFLGRDFATPIMGGALSHLKSGMAAYAEGARRAGAACCIGMGDNETLVSCLETGAGIIKIIKPYADRDEIFSRIRCAREYGALAVGMDISHAIKPESPEFDTVVNCPMKVPSLAELKEYIAAANLPFFIKDVLSVRDAQLAQDIGAAGVILGHHHDLMHWAVPPVMILPAVRKAVGDDFLLIADGGIQDGFDAFKALALGADMVCTGRALMDPCAQEGAEGVAQALRTMTEQLACMMFRTASADVRHIDPGVIHQAWWI